MLRKIYLFVVGLLVCSFNSFSQSTSGGIKVTLKDKGNNEAIPFANVVAYQNGVQVGVGTTNMDGECIIKPLAPGKYDVKGVYVGFQASEVKGVLVGEGKTAYVNIALSNGEGVKLDEVEIVTYQVPLIDPDMKQGQTVDREQYQNMATKDVNSVAATTAGVYQSDEGGSLQVRGGRDGATTYFIDGIKVVGGLSGLPQQSIEQINVITGGLPAQYGDATSGVVSVTTRGPQSKFGGGVELISSQLTDAYGYNSLGFSLGGPILTRTDSNGVKNTVMGFFLSGQGTYQKDPIPSYITLYKLDDNKLKDIQEAPLVPSRTGSGFNKALEYVTKDDLKPIKAHQNVASRQVAVNGKIDIKATKNTNITIGGAYDYGNSHQLVYAYSLFNAENNPQQISNNWRAYARITQKFGNSSANQTEKEKSQALISNAFFSFLASFDKTGTTIQDDTHKDKYFDYGYIGKFTTNFSGKENIFNYQFNPKLIVGNDTIKAWQYTGRSATSVDFQASDMNYNMARYTQYLYDYYGTNAPEILNNMTNIAGLGGLRNGDRPSNVYTLWLPTGRQYGGLSKGSTSQFRIATSFNADVKNHALTVGMEYDQREERNWNINAPGLWDRMRLLANNHLTNLDTQNPILVPELSGTYPAYFYQNQYNADQQSEFSIKLLEKLGLPRDYREKLNVDELDPSTFSLDMFSAEDLLSNNAGSQLVDYNGYDYKGNKTSASTNLNEFLNQKDALGYHTFPVGAFKPIYMAGYIQDKFDFRDIKFNVGLRVDRYDANQKVLKDQYSIYTTRTVGDTKDQFSHPGNMGSDYVVYTSGIDGGSVVGYRNGDQWYDSKGSEVSDPNLLVGGSGKVTPYLTDESVRLYNAGTPFNVDAFKNYKAQVNFMPRVAFSFPISDVANFFAHYDVLTKRPSGNRFDPKDYYYLQSQSSTPGLANPNLRPERTVDYELGFNQILNERKNAAIKFSAFYREFRDMLTQKQIVAAYPRSYITYVNQDFGTTKGMSVEFDLRRTGGARLNANYTLQFAEGSGSNANSGANLASSGQPNLRVTNPLDFDQRHTATITYDYRFGSGKDYKGPKMKRKKDGNDFQLLQDVGFNLQFLVGSGTPYTRWSSSVAQGSNQRSNIAGSINGSYKPWQFRANLRIDKNVQLTWGKKDSEDKKKANLNIYLQVLNLFNTRNIANVYSFTGNADDDGFLNSPLALSTVQNLNSPQGFMDQYTIYMNNPANYNRPRVIRIGLQLDF
jgi:hypothetical protein